MLFLKRSKIRSYEMGLLFRDGEFRGLLGEGVRWFFDPLGKVRVDVVSQRDPWLVHEKLDLIVESGALAERAVVLDLKDHERAMVWIENRFSRVLPAAGGGSCGTLSPDAPERFRARVQRAEQAVTDGLYAYWTGQKHVRVEVADARNVRFEHDELKVIARSPLAQRVLDICTVERDRVGVLFIDGRYIDTLAPGLYAFWKGRSEAKVVEIDLRETMVDVGGRRGRFVLNAFPVGQVA